jgi:hypothetical protein
MLRFRLFRLSVLTAGTTSPPPRPVPSRRPVHPRPPAQYVLIASASPMNDPTRLFLM